MAKLQFATLSNLQEFLNLHNVQIDSKISEAVRSSIKTVSQSEDGYTLYFYTRTAPVTIDEAAFTITLPQPTGKADKVKGAVNGHLAGLDANGNLVDSGKAITDFDEAGAADSAKAEVMGYVGTIPADAKAKNVVAYIKEAVTAGQYDDSALKASVAANTEAINTLNGTGDGSVKKQIDDAFNTFATNITDDNVVNTYKELIDYCATHSAEAAEMAGEISKNAEAIKTLETYVGKLPEGTSAKTVIDYINAKISAVDFSEAIATAKQEAIDASKTYSDGLAKNYATAAQGAKADTALQEADVATLRTDVADVKASIGEGGATTNAIADAKKAGTDASAAVTALADGQVATNKSDIAALAERVGTIEGTSYVAMTDEEIDALFAEKVK